MFSKGKVVGIVLVLAFVGQIMMARADQKYSWNQEITIEAQYGGKTHVARSVHTVTWRTSTGFRLFFFRSLTPKWVREIHGQAPVLPLTDKAALVLLLSDEEQPSLATALPDQFPNIPLEERLAKVQSGGVTATRIAVPTTTLPYLISFKDVTDRGSARLVGSRFNMDRKIPGLGTVRVTLRQTRAAPTPGLISKLFPWVSDPKFKPGSADRNFMPLFSVSDRDKAFVTPTFC